MCHHPHLPGPVPDTEPLDARGVSNPHFSLPPQGADTIIVPVSNRFEVIGAGDATYSPLSPRGLAASVAKIFLSRFSSSLIS